MGIESERIVQYIKDIRQSQEVDILEMVRRRENKKNKDRIKEEIHGETRNRNLKEFQKLGITQLLQEIIDSNIIFQDDSLKERFGIDKASYNFDRDVKKIHLFFDGHKGNRHLESEFGHRVTLSVPFHEGINIHGYEDGEEIIRKRVDFGYKTNEEIRTEISATITEQIVTLQGYKYNRVDFESL